MQASAQAARWDATWDRLPAVKKEIRIGSFPTCHVVILQTFAAVFNVFSTFIAQKASPGLFVSHRSGSTTGLEFSQISGFSCDTGRSGSVCL